MARQYKVMFEGVLIAAPQDLIQITGAAGKVVRILQVWLGCTDTTLAAGQALQTRCRYLPVTVTAGSGGTTPTISKTDPGDAAASFTALANNTTKATTSGTAIVWDEDGNHLYGGQRTAFNERPPIGPSEAFVFELLSTVTGTVHLSGGVLVEEIGG